MPAAESVQEKGRNGARFAKQFLESTTWIELPFNVYTNTRICTLPLMNGGSKRFDLFGSIFTDPPTPLYVEVKDYDSAGGGQPADYWEYLANAYSITARDIADGEDGRRNFMWVTRHPFEQTNWAKLTSASRIREALVKHPEVLAGEGIDDDTLSAVSERLWLIVVHQRQNALMLTPEELSIVESQLRRKVTL